VLRLLPKFDHPDLLVGPETSDDAGVFRLREDLAIVNTVDFFTPIVDDPFVFGQIAAANALSDVYAMGGDPLTALNILGFPKGSLGLEVMTEILKGGSERARAAGAVVVGGHTIIDSELKYGMAVTGAIHPNRIFRNTGVRPGDALVLTKPLGTGIVTTALKRRQATRRSVRAATASMVELNRTASQVARSFAVHACSDVTGFGLLGHAVEMAMGSGVSLVLDATALPLLPDAPALAARGFVTGGCGRNRLYLADKVVVERGVNPALQEVAFDPQTSGGLLIAVDRRVADRLVRALRRAKVHAATVVGRAVAKRDALVYLTSG
jgi:selenide, water dikinase